MSDFNTNMQQMSDSADDEMPLANRFKTERIDNKNKLKRSRKNSKSSSKKIHLVTVKTECDGRDPLGISDGESISNMGLERLLSHTAVAHIKQELPFDVENIKYDVDNDEDFQFFKSLVPLMEQLTPEKKSNIRKDLINMVIQQCNEAIEHNEHSDDIS